MINNFISNPVGYSYDHKWIRKLNDEVAVLLSCFQSQGFFEVKLEGLVLHLPVVVVEGDEDGEQEGTGAGNGCSVLLVLQLPRRCRRAGREEGSVPMAALAKGPPF